MKYELIPILIPEKITKWNETFKLENQENWDLPSSCDGTSFEIMDLIAMNDVPLRISAMGAVNADAERA